MQVNQDWDIKPRGFACAMCQGPFVDKQTYVSQLAFGAAGYVRRDYCGDCWAKVGVAVASGPGAAAEQATDPAVLPVPAPSAGATVQPPPGQMQGGLEQPREVTGLLRRSSGYEGWISIWKAVFHAPPPPPEEPLKKETAESLLRSLISKNEPVHKNVIFILAVMLERRRMLVERDVQTREDGSTLRVYEHRRTGETILVTDPHLDLNQLGQVQEEVLAMLGGKPETPGQSSDVIQES